MEVKLMNPQEQLRKAERERCQALEELEELEEIKWRMLSEKENQRKAEARVRALESELDKARESERRMLESLTCQTKQLEQTKILLEEARLENQSLKYANMKSAANDSEEMSGLRTELLLALSAEEKSKKAMDDLAMALKEVTMDNGRMKEKLCQTKCELENARGEMELLKATLRRTEGKLFAKAEEAKRLKAEAEESFAAWQEKETGFLECVKMCEDEITCLRQEYEDVAQAQKAARDETSKLRDIMKQAINEASVVKEALELTRRENSELMDMLAAKDSSIEALTLELECVKRSETATLDTVKELQSLLVASYPVDLPPTAPPAPTATTTNTKSPAVARKKMAKYPSENWRYVRPRSLRLRRRSLGDSDRFEGSIFDLLDSPKQRMSEAEVGLAMENVNTGKARSMDATFGSGNPTERKPPINGADSGWDSQARQKLKKRQILRRFGDLLRRSVHI